MNGEQVLEKEDAVLRGGKAGLAKFRQTHAQFRRFRIGGNLERDQPGPALVAERSGCHEIHSS